MKCRSEKGIFAVDDLTVVDVLAVFVDKFGREGGTAENDGDGDAAIVEDVEILLHERSGFDQQTAHRNTVGFVLLVGFDNAIDGLLDAQVNNAIAVVGQNNIHQVFANVVNIPFDSRDDENAFCLPGVFIFHEGFQEGDSSFHRFGGLQYKGELHLTRAEEFAHDFHPVQQERIDDIEGRILLHCLLQRIVYPHAFAINDVLLQAFFQWGDRQWQYETIAPLSLIPLQRVWSVR